MLVVVASWVEPMIELVEPEVDEPEVDEPSSPELLVVQFELLLVDH